MLHFDLKSVKQQVLFGALLYECRLGFYQKRGNNYKSY